MNRRNFLKGFLAVTGTLAVAPAMVLEPVEHCGTSEVWPIMEEIMDCQMSLNRILIEMDRLMGMPKIILLPPKCPEN